MFGVVRTGTIQHPQVVRRTVFSAAATAVGGLILLACTSSDPPQEFTTVIKDTRRACIEGDSAYEGVADGIVSVEQARTELLHAIIRAESASDLIFDTEELMPVRSDRDIRPAAVAGKLRLMHDYLVEDNPFAFTESRMELRMLCDPLDTAYSNWHGYK